MKPKIICISGKAGAGKDTVGKCLAEHLSEHGCTRIMHYADLLKFICRTYLDWNGEKDERGRRLLQMVGTDTFRANKPDYWVDFLATVAYQLGNDWKYVVIPDARFPNEISRWNDFGFDVIHVRVWRDNNGNALHGECALHKSETALDDVKPDIVFENDVDAESPEFEAKIKKLAHDIDKFFMTASKKEDV